MVLPLATCFLHYKKIAIVQSRINQLFGNLLIYNSIGLNSLVGEIQFELSFSLPNEPNNISDPYV